MKPANILDTPIEYLKGVGPVRAETLRSELGIFTFNDLLCHFPFRYVDRSKFFRTADIRDDSVYVQLKGRITGLQKIGSGKATRMVAWLEDDSGSIELVWFRGLKWLQGRFSNDKEYIVFGKPNNFGGKFSIPHPEIEVVTEESLKQADPLHPIYSSTDKLKSKGLDSKGIGKIMKSLTLSLKDCLPEFLPVDLVTRHGFISREEALLQIHFPGNPDLLAKAQRRLKFEEFLHIQLNLLALKAGRSLHNKGCRFTVVGDYVNRFYREKLPFELTAAQKKVIREIRSDLGSGLQMNRMLQGDVGSGKTVVALMVMLIALDNGYQCCLMAPTEILAGQHFASLNSLLSGLGVSIELLTGSTKGQARKSILERLLDGSIQILIGTHALIEEKVRFSNLGLVVIDEQHKFGVAQRAGLWSKSPVLPHVLIMTATPIPRTLGMTLYGDLDFSIIDELPPGRKEIKTIHTSETDRGKLYVFLKKQIRLGRQIYVVYPLISESEKLDLKALMDGYEHLVREFPPPDFRVVFVHGQMNGQEKEQAMQSFQRGEAHVLVATTVIEVGVDVPNASVMVIENAERFGLSQLHQLRGRVGRGPDQSYCILMSGDKLSADARVRLDTMVRTSNGFEIAETDLRLRGPGDLMGTLQSGMIDLKIADLVKDEKILQLAREVAGAIIRQDPRLQEDRHRPLAEWLRRNNTSRPDWSLVG
jgi:ATP-dependent DNA helicase RecG